MPDQKSNLEPIDEKDLNLKEKFSDGNEAAPAEKAGIIKEQPGREPAAEEILKPEKLPERKEGMVEKEDTYAKIISKVSSAQSPVANEEISQDAEIAMREKDAESKVNNLISLAEIKGVAHAVKVARHMQDNYILDEFHDKLLTDELHEFLVKKGLVKET